MSEPSVLLVDDERQFRTILSKRLTLRGFDIRQAPGGREALECMESKPADVVVLDVKMVEMDGIETLRRIRKQYLETEVILLTGHASTKDGVEGIKAGAFDYLTKPVELEHLAGKIQQAFERILRAREKRREQEFRSRMEHRLIAAERLAALGVLATGIAHEINNPLAVINDAAGWLRSLVMKNEDMPLARELDLGLGKIESSVARARRITHQLLGHARQSGPEIAQVDLGQLVQEAAELVGKQARTNNVELAISAPEKGLAIQSDPGQLRQVFINLFSNAIQAVNSGGRVEAVLTPEEHDVRVLFMDNGPGIAPEYMDHLFEPFFSTKPAGEGTGLGLFVSNEILHRLGGSITPGNNDQCGAYFLLSIPREYKDYIQPEEIREQDHDSRPDTRAAC